MRGREWLCVGAMAWLLVPAAWGQHLDLRQQWQPQTENDPRLTQRVQMEILGRAVVTGLPLLSEKTGVLLDVAPEDRETLGERKFTLLAQGCELKSIMVQLCTALQECHWDVDLNGEQAVYLLHRVPGEERAARERKEEQEARGRAERQAARGKRMAEARAALKMSASELKELEKTDVLLARAAQDRHTRALMEAVLSLAPEQVMDWYTEGAEFVYAQAPGPLRKAVEETMAANIAWFRANPRRVGDNRIGEMETWRERGARVMLGFSDRGCDFGFGIRMMVDIPQTDRRHHYEALALPPRRVSTDEGSGDVERMLLATGAPTKEAAWDIIRQSEREGFVQFDQRIEDNRKASQVAPTDPVLLQVVKLEADRRELPAIQQSLARQTGLSIASDYYVGRRTHVPEELVTGLPLWQFLYKLGEGREGRPASAWEKRGSLLVFHEVDWPSLAAEEVPESLIVAY